jgi:hypothetical protein
LPTFHNKYNLLGDPWQNVPDFYVNRAKKRAGIETNGPYPLGVTNYREPREVDERGSTLRERNSSMSNHHSASNNNSINANTSAAIVAAIQLILSNATANQLPTSTQISPASNTSNSPSFLNKNDKQHDFNSTLKLLEILFQSLMPANYSQQSVRSSNVMQAPSKANDTMAALPNMKMNENLTQSGRGAGGVKLQA